MTDFKSQNVSKNIRLVIILIIIGMIGLGWIFFYPKVQEILEARRVIQHEQARLDKLKVKLKDLQNLNETELNSKKDTAIRAMPHEKNFLGMLETISKAATEKGLIVDSFTVKPGKLTDRDTEVLFKITFLGDVEQVKQFLDQVEKTIPLIATQGKIELSLNEPGEVMIQIKGYYLPMPEKLGSIETPVLRLSEDEAKRISEVANYTYYLTVESVAPPTGKTNPFVF